MVSHALEGMTLETTIGPAASPPVSIDIHRAPGE
jgi:hypothetical protein